MVSISRSSKHTRTNANLFLGKDKDAKVATEKCIQAIEKDKTIVGYWAFKQPKADENDGAKA